MRQTWRIARREFRSYFDHATAYILIVAFLGLGLYLSFRSIFPSGRATLRPMFDLLPWLFLVFVPAITMRSLAEERRTGTLEWLLSQPVNEAEIVAGKFLGDWLFALVALAGTLPTATGLLLVSSADPGIMAAQYAGAAMLAATMVAVGLFASSTTNNQITAFILGVAVSFALLLAGLGFVQQGLPSAVAGVVGRLSVITHFENVARGVIDLRDALYFVSASFLFLTLSYAAIVRRRLSRGRNAYRRLRVGTGAIVLGVMTLNLLGGHIHGRLDLTRNDLYTLSTGTKDVLRGLDDVITVKFFVSEELPPEVTTTRRDVGDLLRDYRRFSDGNLRYEVIHPDEEEGGVEEARQLGVREIRFNVVRGDEFQVKRGWMGLAIQFAGETDVIPVIQRTSDLEYRLTSSIASLAAGDRPVVAFLSGFGARTQSDYPELNRVLGDRYSVRSLALDADTISGLSPDSVRTAVLAAPRDSLSDAARDAVTSYLTAGGSLLALVESVTIGRRMPVARPLSTGVGSLLEPWGLRLEPGIVFDLRSNERVPVSGSGIFSAVRSYPFWPVVQPAGDHIITRGLQGLSLGWASAVTVVDTARVRPLLSTTDAGGVRPPGTSISPESSVQGQVDSLRTVSVAAAARGDSGRIVLVGDADFLGDAFTRANPQNLSFAANAVDWLAQDESLIEIRSKNRAPPQLVFESAFQRRLLRWGNLVGVPLLFVLFGTARIVGRRRLASRSWPEEVTA